MNRKNNKSGTDTHLEFLAKVLSWNYGKDITPLHVLTAYQLYKITGAPFEDCIGAVIEAHRAIDNK